MQASAQVAYTYQDGSQRTLHTAGAVGVVAGPEAEWAVVVAVEVVVAGLVVIVVRHPRQRVAGRELGMKSMPELREHRSSDEQG